jgi:hypothetical protein
MFVQHNKNFILRYCCKNVNKLIGIIIQMATTINTCFDKLCAQIYTTQHNTFFNNRTFLL